MYKIAKLSATERGDLFRETASRKHVTNAIAEKDFWVVWTLGKIFSDKELNKKLMFKGGTSLSKIYKLIERFSEDIDLILDWELITNKDPQGQRSNTKQYKLNMEINQQAQTYIAEKLLPKISNLLAPECQCYMDKDDGFKIRVKYPKIFTDEAILPEILLEIGPLALWVPHDEFHITSYAAEIFPEKFLQPECTVRAIVAKRTFWEKATILHREVFRKAERPIPSRYSRHYYDLAMMAESDVKEHALQDIKLLEDVVDFKDKFYHCGWANYHKAKEGDLRLVPPDYRIKELKDDYGKMRSMIFGHYPEFEDILETLGKLEKEIKGRKE